MARAALMLTVGAGILAGVANGAAATKKAAPCTPEATTVLNVRTERLCGATATIRLGERTLRFRSGECVRVTGGRRALFSVSIRGLSSRFFGLTVIAGRDGVYRNAVIVVQHAGTSYALKSSSLTLAGRRSRGTFSGRGFAVTSRREVLMAAVSGSFRC
jgi:hypothetical protein